MASVVKTKSELYQVRHSTFEGWGDVFVSHGENYVSVAINSDYGTFGYTWRGSFGCSPMEFLTTIKMNYAMNKLTNGAFYIDDVEKFPQEIKEQIVSMRRGGSITKDEARNAWESMLDCEYDYDAKLYRHELYTNSLGVKIFPDSEDLPSAKIKDPLCVDFWNNVWLPFIEQVKESLALADARLQVIVSSGSGIQ